MEVEDGCVWKVTLETYDFWTMMLGGRIIPFGAQILQTLDDSGGRYEDIKN